MKVWRKYGALALAITVISSLHAAPAGKLPSKLIRISKPRIALDRGDTNNLFLKMEFNGAIPLSALKNITPDRIESISLAYSRYKLNKEFDQEKLNMQRMEKLYSLIPGLKENRQVQWYWVEQTSCNDPEACEGYFHGFIIRLKSPDKAMMREIELGLVEYYMSIYEGDIYTARMDSLVRAAKHKFRKKCDTVVISTMVKGNRLARIRGWDNSKNAKIAKMLKEELEDSGEVSLSFEIDKNGNQYTSLLEGKKYEKIASILESELKVMAPRYKGKKVPALLRMEVRYSGAGVLVDFTQEPVLPDNQKFNEESFLYNKTKEVRCDYIDTTVKSRITPSILTTPEIIFKVFDRNRQWDNVLIATDVTASMYPYLAQFQVWHKLNYSLELGNRDFVFFNDGDDMPDMFKVTGRVGGIYYVHTSEYEELLRTMRVAIQNGGGGDIPENNIEAVLEGLKKKPDCKEVIMIADNLATPRDLNMLSSVKVPIRLILCAAQNGINTEYLDMIRSNHGSIHTMKEDEYNLYKMKEGDRVTLDGFEYMLKNGHFIRLEKTAKP